MNNDYWLKCQNLAGQLRERELLCLEILQMRDNLIAKLGQHSRVTMRNDLLAQLNGVAPADNFNLLDELSSINWHEVMISLIIATHWVVVSNSSIGDTVQEQVFPKYLRQWLRNRTVDKPSAEDLLANLFPDETAAIGALLRSTEYGSWRKLLSDLMAENS